MSRWLLWLAFGFLATHELDAMLAAEWRVLPITAWLPEPTARTSFVLSHVPLFAALGWGVSHPKPKVALRWQQGLMAFCMVHGGLHLLFAGHPHYHFTGVISHGLIGAAGLCGAGWWWRHWRVRAAA